MLGTLVITLFALLPEDEIMRWGWRIPFLLSAAMLAIGLFVRAKVSESPIFRAAAEQADNEKAAPPIVEVPRRPKVVVLAAFGPFVAAGQASIKSRTASRVLRTTAEAAIRGGSKDNDLTDVR
ncbi:hypothetical protein AB0I53_12390 [Saccharopolyspora sp. NPDC050389]|uniref:hypothetical protein n=1 Tax=Saccharopolyspora sp. NPDC050389 TaxID=3155516 RepID=UPI0033F4DB5B